MFPSLAFFVLSRLLAPTVATTPGELLARRDAMHGKPVSVAGTVSKYAAKVSRAGNKYTVFTLEDGGKKVSVYHRGHAEPPLKDGDRATAAGVFEKERKVGTFTVKDQVDATERPGRQFGVRKA